jgi:TDG/mug DNA glycosylase family protein
VLAPRLRVLFCGINPSLYSAATGHHFARPGNRFWPALHRAGFTDRQLSPFEDASLPDYALGCTNLVNRATARADEVTKEELVQGGERLREVAGTHRPAWVAVLGIGAYRAALDPGARAIGAQRETLGPARLWVLPNPSGINAHYQLADLAEAFADLRHATEGQD